jgi:hypothetical protein
MGYVNGDRDRDRERERERKEYTRFDRHLLAFGCSSAIGLFIV